jgi:hypothetical protein
MLKKKTDTTFPWHSIKKTLAHKRKAFFILSKNKGLNSERALLSFSPIFQSNHVDDEGKLIK